MARRKSSLVENINKRKRAGKSRSKSRSTVSSGAYADMQAGWPRSKRAKSRKKSAAKKSSRRKASKKK
jgi:hypothetical protein